MMTHMQGLWDNTAIFLINQSIFTWTQNHNFGQVFCFEVYKKVRIFLRSEADLSLHNEVRTLLNQQCLSIELLFLHRNGNHNEKLFRKLVGSPWMSPSGGAPGTPHLKFLARKLGCSAHNFATEYQRTLDKKTTRSKTTIGKIGLSNICSYTVLKSRSHDHVTFEFMNSLLCIHILEHLNKFAF